MDEESKNQGIWWYHYDLFQTQHAKASTLHHQAIWHNSYPNTNVKKNLLLDSVTWQQGLSLNHHWISISQWLSGTQNMVQNKYLSKCETLQEKIFGYYFIYSFTIQVYFPFQKKRHSLSIKKIWSQAWQKIHFTISSVLNP